MADFVETVQVSLQQDGFCVATGPHDSGIVYPHPTNTNPFAPILLDSPVVLHLYCPELFPDEVLKVHAEHLGHFLSLQCVPRINAESERALFLGLCKLFTRERVLSLYEKFLTDEASPDGAFDMTSEAEGGDDSYPSVFVDVPKSETGRVVSLLRSLLELFDLEELCCENILHERGQEPKHMLFLYLIQLLAIFVSSCMEEKDLATVMSVASAPFLEANFCNPLCAATLVKPMFIPHYSEEQGGRRHRRGVEQTDDPEERLKHYRLFTGYELDNMGCDVSSRQEMSWTEHDILQRMQGCKIVEGESKKLWFVAPQMGDRMLMVGESGLKMIGGQTGEKALKICSYLMSDNIMAYMQCAIFGTISNMMPCHANSDFTEAVMTTIGSSMSKFSDAVRHQSASLMTELSKISNSCLHTAGVGFTGQDKGNTLYFGNVFTGPDEKRPPPSQGRLGVFTSVTVGMTDDTMMKTMLSIALKPDRKLNLHGMLSTRYKPVGRSKVATSTFFYARYHHMFNAGEFTEVACVKAMSDPRYNSAIHGQELTHESKYQLTVCHGALPMCTLTLAMTMRQAVMMVMGFFCAELARLVYLPKTTDAILCKHLVLLAMAAKFRHRKDTENTNVFEASYGDSLKLSGAAFSKPGRCGVNYRDLDTMEWLQADDARLPSYIQSSLKLIGDTKREVRRIMKEKELSYNRVVFYGETDIVKFTSVFANKEYMMHAPVMVLSSMRVFSNNTNSYGSVKMCKPGSWSGNWYPVKVYSNRCVNTSQRTSQRSRDIDCLTSETKTTIDEMVEKIKRGVSSLLPRIELNRLKMMSPELNDTEFDLFVSAVKSNNIKVIGQQDSACCSTSPGLSSSPDQRIGMKRARESPDVSLVNNNNKKAKMDSELTVMDTDVDFGFDDSD